MDNHLFFICHEECITLEELIKIGKELGVIEDG
jgi:hypothetical protein